MISEKLIMPNYTVTIAIIPTGTASAVVSTSALAASAPAGT